MLPSILALLVFSTTISAQTPLNFSPNVTTKLQVKFGSKSVTTGFALTKAETAKIPTMGTSDEALKGTYNFFVINLDAPGSFVGGAAGTRVTNLHCLLTGYTSATMATNSLYTLTNKDASVKAYVGAGPPAETPPYAHKNVELLYMQPEGFKVPSAQISSISNGISMLRSGCKAGCAG
ncbi:hypothetical protein WAI453_007874 [Rhynchosporium graminicola]|uniref:CHRD domain-containing protein n=1 Tax=Rhynchosporium graminicola TaxID=2792576 RepID=A0A1E1KUU8_9HELO|nr:uncharacterized protein RCO7_05423 [Rhynchosporium commune]